MQKIALCNRAGIFPSWLIAFATGHEEDSGSRFLIKTLLVMRLTILFLTVGLLNVHAKGISQSVTLSGKNVSLEQIFSAIETQTGYMVFYNKDDLRGAKPVTLSVYDLPLTDFLEMALKDQKLSYEVKSKTILIMELIKGNDDKASVHGQLTSVDLWQLITGRIVERGGRSVANATIAIKGKPHKVAADKEGSFSINADIGEVLVISSVGFVTKEITVEVGKTTLLIELEIKTSDLDEVNVVAYGTTTRREATGSISVIKQKDIADVPAANIANLLQGRVAGLDIANNSGSPGGGGLSITIRGYNSLDVEQGRRFSNPLWVVDGVPLNTFTSPVTGTNLLSDLNPDMIESIQILKDASAASLYGSRAANGVIIVTTKKGGKNQPMQLSVNVSQTYSVLPRLPLITIGKQERELRLQAFKNMPSAYLDLDNLTYTYPTTWEEVYKYQGYIDFFFQKNISTKNGLIYQDSLNSFYNNSTNFFPAYYERGKVTNANIQTYGGTDKVNFGIGLGYYQEDGIVKGSGFRRIDLNSSFTVVPISRFTIDLRSNISVTNRGRGDKPANYIGGYSPIIETVPGDPFALSSLFPGPGTDYWQDVLDKLSATKETNQSVRIRSNFKLGYDIINNLNFSSSLSADYAVHRRNTFEPSYLKENNYSSSLGETGINLMVLNENILRYKKTINYVHSVEAVAGISYQYDRMEYNGGIALNSPSNDIYYSRPGFPQYGSETYGTTVNVVPFQSYLSDMQEKALVSQFLKLEYNYQKKYMLTLSYRRDGSSVFGENNKWGNFPSVAGAWVFSQEKFMKSFSTFIDFAKMRISWGKSGMHFDQNYLALGIIEPGRTPFEGIGVLRPNYRNGLYNDNLSWEKTDQYDIGLDVDLFNNRLSLTADYYYRYTTDMLMQVRLPGSYNGYSMQWRNAAAVSNEGVEVMLTYELMRKKGVSWKLSLNTARNWNLFRKSYDGKDASINSKYVIGKPLNGIYSFLTDGFVKSQADVPRYFNAGGIVSYYNGSEINYFKPGDYNFLDLDGDGKLSGANDMAYIGSALPFLTGGIGSQGSISLTV